MIWGIVNSIKKQNAKLHPDLSHHSNYIIKLWPYWVTFVETWLRLRFPKRPFISSRRAEKLLAFLRFDLVLCKLVSREIMMSTAKQTSLISWLSSSLTSWYFSNAPQIADGSEAIPIMKGISWPGMKLAGADRWRELKGATHTCAAKIVDIRDVVPL